MFGIPKSITILDKINKFIKFDKKFSKKYTIVITPPHTLLQSYSKFFLNKMSGILFLFISVSFSGVDP